MARRLPPLNALRVFEASARHLSFTKAAEELHVTQAAVSHQVKALEGALGLKLFRRYNRRLSLTEAGKQFLPPLREAFDMIAEASARLSDEEETGSLKVSVLPSFAAKWLLPRLGDFRATNPEIDVLLSASNELVDFERDDIDVGIRFGFGDYPELFTQKLMDDEAFPICSPKLLEGPNPLRSPEDLENHTLLHDESPNLLDWNTWRSLAGKPEIRTDFGPRFTDASMAIEAAAAGNGVAIARSSLVRADLRSGRLIKPFGPSLKSRFAYYLVCAKSQAERPKIKKFRSWIAAQVREDLEA